MNDGPPLSARDLDGDGKDYRSAMRQMQAQLREKAKYVEELQNQRFVLQNTVGRENADLKMKVQDAKGKLDEMEYHLKRKSKQLDNAEKEIE